MYTSTLIKTILDARVEFGEERKDFYTFIKQSTEVLTAPK